MDENEIFKESFDEFLECLREHEIATHTKFVLTDSRKEFTLHKDLLDFNKKIRWQDDVPFLHFGSRTYSCHQGRDSNLYQKKKYAEERDHKACMDLNFTKRYNLTKVTKKLDCPASIRVTRIMKFTQYKISGKMTDFVKAKSSKKIREILLKKEDIGQLGYVFKLPPIELHKNHLVGSEYCSVEPIDQRVRDQITKLVYKGESSAAVIRKILISFVENELQEYDHNRRRFYPDVSDIRNIVYKVKSSIQNETTDEHMLADNEDQDIGQPKLNELPLRGSKKRHIINECNASMRSIQSVLWNLNESNLENVSSVLKTLFQELSSKVEKDSTTGLPIESLHQATTSARPSEGANWVELGAATTDIVEEKRELGQLKRLRNKGLSGYVGAIVDMMKEHSYISVIENSEGPEQKKKKM